MLYIVSGFMRCGTSMMMQALEAGGMQAAYSQRRDNDMNARWGEPGYKPNDNYYELDAADYRQDLASIYDGKLVKCLAGGLIRMAPSQSRYRIVFMRRPVAEIRTSLTAFFGTSEPAASPDFDAWMDRVVAVMRDRRSVAGIDEVQYHDVLRDPLSVFERLAVRGWPIDPAKAEKIPTRAKARFANVA
jgi:hypothetical protein